ncbi:hypothetical protein [Prevotella sp. 10(H)]|uniref:hypothetical protein n=1 Tax=Prevotella sp. 10(H) TaxID=1158294 RepID=UPI0004A6D4AF|nr:hypothetical protein [Prevotella sp. 10(H)]
MENITTVIATLDSDGDVTKENETPNMIPEVLDAYFTYQTSKEKKPLIKKKAKSKTKTETQSTEPAEEKSKYEYTFTKIDRSNVSANFHIVVESKNIADKKIKISLCSVSEKVLSEIDATVTLLYGEEELSEKELDVENYYADESVYNKDDFKDKTIFEVTLSPKSDEDKKKWIDAIANSTSKKASLYIKVEVLDLDNVVYKGKGDRNKCFLYEKPFELYVCHCDRKIGAGELSYIIYKLSGGETSSLFAGYNSKIKKSDRTYERLAEEMNAVFEKYEINTCNRKAHFLAQSYAETGFSTATEFAGGKDYELANWEAEKKKLEDNISDIDTLKPKIDKILTDLQKTALDEKKSQLDEISAKITSDIKLTKEQEETVNKYKAIFETKWKPQLDEKATKQYTTKEAYTDALNGNSGKKIRGAIPRIKTIKDSKNLEIGDGPRYKGKGVIQITWRATYEDYFKYIKTKDPIPDSVKDKTVEQILSRKEDDMSQLLGSDLFYAIDSAGWFWNEYKKGYKLAETADYDGDTIAPENPYKGKKTIEKISRIVNGGTYHLKERTNNYNMLRNDLFKIKTNCSKRDEIK